MRVGSIFGRAIAVIAGLLAVLTVVACGSGTTALPPRSTAAVNAATHPPRARVRATPAGAGTAGSAGTAGTASAGTPGAGIQASSGCSTPRSPGDSAESLESGGVTRTYRVHVPSGYDPAVRTPLVLNFHGSSRTGADQEAYSGLVPVADQEGFILVSPDGLDEQWTIAVNDDPAALTTDDMVFTTDLLAQLRAELCIDDLRVYAAGMSNGAEMASQVGCLLPADFAAIAPVAGVEYDGCSGAGMPVIAFQGTDDQNVPFDTAEPAMADWADHNGCSGGPTSAAVTAHVSAESYAGCNGADVVLYVVDGGGHTWPGAQDDVAYGGAGATTHEIDASKLIWAFFEAHPRPG